MRARFSAVLICLTVLSSAFADVDYEEIVIVGDPSQSRLNASQIDLDSTTSFARVVSRAEFESQFTTLADILDKEVGIQIRQVGGTGSFSTISMRGSNGKQLSVFLDGVLLNSAQGGLSDISLIPLSSVERIEIYPDYTPIQLGNANLSGAINIVTLQALKEEYQVSAKANSIGGESLAALASGSTGNWYYALTMESIESDNSYDTILRDGSEEERLNSESEQLSGYLKVGYQVSPDTDISIVAQHLDHLRGIPSIQNDPNDFSKLHDQLGRYRFKLDTNYAGIEATHQLVYQESESVYDQRENVGSLGRDWLNNSVETVGILNHWLLVLDEHDLRFGIEYKKEDYSKENLKNGAKELENQRKEWVISLQDVWYISQRLSLSANARHFSTEDSAEIVDDGKTGFGVDEVRPNVENSETTYHVGFNYDLYHWLRFKGNFAHTVRTPTMLELFGETGSFVGEPELRPETANNLDVGLESSLSNFDFSILLYTKAIDDYIALIYGGFGQAKPENLAEVEMFGTEVEASFQVNDWLGFRAGFDLLDSEITTIEKARNGKQLPGIYHENSFVELNTAFENWNIDISYSVKKDMFYDATEREAADTAEQVNASATWKYEGISVNIAINNLTDNRFFEFDRYSNIGRVYSAAINYKW